MAMSSGKSAPTPSTPPPGYVESVGGASASQPAAPAAPAAQTVPPAPAGPTPLGGPGMHLLPLHDPRSAHALREATRRARWRFLEALVLAWAICVLVGGLGGWGAAEANVNLKAMRR
jgi:hypothetical protein